MRVLLIKCVRCLHTKLCVLLVFWCIWFLLLYSALHKMKILTQLFLLRFVVPYRCSCNARSAVMAVGVIGHNGRWFTSRTLEKVRQLSKCWPSSFNSHRRAKTSTSTWIRTNVRSTTPVWTGAGTVRAGKFAGNFNSCPRTHNARSQHFMTRACCLCTLFHTHADSWPTPPSCICWLAAWIHADCSSFAALANSQFDAEENAPIVVSKQSLHRHYRLGNPAVNCNTARRRYISFPTLHFTDKEEDGAAPIAD